HPPDRARRRPGDRRGDVDGPRPGRARPAGGDDGRAPRRRAGAGGRALALPAAAGRARHAPDTAPGPPPSGNDVSRLPYLRREDLDDPAVAAWDAVVAPRGPDAVNDEGGLVGPFNAWLHAPGIGARLNELVTALRHETSLDRRLIELAILVVGAHWRS